MKIMLIIDHDLVEVECNVQRYLLEIENQRER